MIYSTNNYTKFVRVAIDALYWLFLALYTASLSKKPHFSSVRLKPNIIFDFGVGRVHALDPPFFVGEDTQNNNTLNDLNETSPIIIFEQLPETHQQIAFYHIHPPVYYPSFAAGTDIRHSLPIFQKQNINHEAIQVQVIFPVR